MAPRTGILEQFCALNVWRQGDRRAPHKPLLALYALAAWSRGREELRFDEVDRDVGQLLRDFGPPSSTTAEYPFWHLQTDGVWTLRSADGFITADRRSRPGKLEMLAHDVRGALAPEILGALRSDPALLGRIARLLLEAHFPESMHAEILASIGLDIEATEGDDVYLSRRKKRDPTFRVRVLEAYEGRCCLCDFDARLGGVSIALEAAHIRWHQAGGPDVVGNGLALCTLHHKALDHGAVTIDPDHLSVLVSDRLDVSERARNLILDFHGRPIRKPQRDDLLPHADHLAWHRREVFRGRPRAV